MIKSAPMPFSILSDCLFFRKQQLNFWINHVDAGIKQLRVMCVVITTRAPVALQNCGGGGAPLRCRLTVALCFSLN